MIEITNTEITGWEHAIRGMRNPMNSWDKSDTVFLPYQYCDSDKEWEIQKVCGGVAPVIGANDLNLMRRLVKAGSAHAKYKRMINVYCDITAPMYWWKEWDTYLHTVRNSCSTMHKIHAKEFTIDDFSVDRMSVMAKNSTKAIICYLNECRNCYLNTKDKEYWYSMIQLLPSSYNQKSTVMMNYETLTAIYRWRRNHKLDEWQTFCDWIEKLPYSELITGVTNEADL